MNKTREALAFFATAISIAALTVAMIGGALMIAIEGVLGLFIQRHANGVLNYPLVRGVLVLYACGIALGLVAWQRPVAAGIAMLPLGVCAFLFGGPVAQVYGIIIVCVGVLFLATGTHRDKA